MEDYIAKCEKGKHYPMNVSDNPQKPFYVCRKCCVNPIPKGEIKASLEYRKRIIANMRF